MKKILFYFHLSIIFSSILLAQDISSGIKLIKYEKFNEAKKTFNSLLNGKSKVEAYFYLGEIYFIEEKIDSAKIFYKKGMEADIDFPLNYAGMVRLNVLDGNDSEIAKNRNQAIDLDEENPKVYVVLADAYAHIKYYDTAMQFLNQALENKISDPDVYIMIGKVHLSKINGTEAIKNFEEALKLEPGNPEALTQKAKVYSLINNYTGAISLLEEAIAGDPAYSPAYNELAEVYANLKDYAKAAEYYAMYIDKSESTLEKQKRYASILYLNKEYEKAIAILEKLIQIETDNSSSIRIVAYSYLRLESVEASKYYFQKLFSISGIDYLPTDYENYADLLSKTGDDSLAIEYLTKVTDLDSSRKDIYGKISVLYFKNKKWDGVVSSLEQKGTLTAQEYFDLGKANMFIGDKAVAEVTESLNSSITLTDDQKREFVRPALLYYQGDLRDSKGDASKIDVAINKVSSTIEPSLVKEQKTKWATVKTAWLIEVRNKIQLDYAKADTALTMLVQKVPDLAVAYFWRARVNTNFDPESKLGLAKPFYEQFIERAAVDKDKFKKELIESYQYLGYYYYLQEDNVKSKVYWQEVLNLDPENKQANDVLKMLK